MASSGTKKQAVSQTQKGGCVAEVQRKEQYTTCLETVANPDGSSNQVQLTFFHAEKFGVEEDNTKARLCSGWAVQE